MRPPVAMNAAAAMTTGKIPTARSTVTAADPMPFDSRSMDEPRTIGELLDAAAAVDDQGQAFGAVIQGLFSALERMEAKDPSP